MYLYADDSKIYKVIRNRSDEEKLQSVMNLVKKLVGRVASQIKY